MLDCHQRIGFERLKCKIVIGRTKGLCIKHRVISLKQLLNDVKNRRFACSCRSVKYHKLLKLLGIAVDHRADSPFDLLSFFRRIYDRHKLVVCGKVALLQRIWQLLTRIIFFGRLCVGKYKFLIQHVVGISHLLLTVFMPGVYHSALSVPHMKDSDIGIKFLTVLFGKFVKFFVYQLNSVLLFGRPKSFVFKPNRIKISASNHQIGAFLDHELGVYFDRTPLAAAGRNH